MKKLHEVIIKQHLRGRALAKKVLKEGYDLPTMIQEPNNMW